MGPGPGLRFWFRARPRAVLAGVVSFAMVPIVSGTSAPVSAAPSLPKSFSGQELKAQATGSYIYCALAANPNPGNCLPMNMGGYYDSVTNVDQTYIVKQVQYDARNGSPGNYDLMHVGTWSVTGTEHHDLRWQSNSNPEECQWTNTLATGPYASSQLNIPSSNNASVAVELPTKTTSSGLSGKCGSIPSSVPSWARPYSSPTQEMRGPSFSGPYDAATGKISLMTSFCATPGGGQPGTGFTLPTCTGAGGLMAQSSPGPPPDEDCAHPAGPESLCTQCPSNITVVPEQLPTATTGHAYREQLRGINGAAPYSFSTAGTLPAGLTLSGDGVLAGKVSASPGTYPLNFNVLDARGCQGTNLSLQLSGSVPTIFPQGFTLRLHVGATGARDTAAGRAQDGRRSAVGASGSTQFSTATWVLGTNRLTHGKPGSTVRVCTKKPLLVLKLQGRVVDVHKGRRFSATWYVNGHVRHEFRYRWAESGSYPTAFVIANLGGLPLGHWRFQLSDGTSGRSALTVKSGHC